MHHYGCMYICRSIFFKQSPGERDENDPLILLINIYHSQYIKLAYIIKQSQFYIKSFCCKIEKIYLHRMANNEFIKDSEMVLLFMGKNQLNFNSQMRWHVRTL